MNPLRTRHTTRISVLIYVLASVLAWGGAGACGIAEQGPSAHHAGYYSPPAPCGLHLRTERADCCSKTPTASAFPGRGSIPCCNSACPVSGPGIPKSVGKISLAEKRMPGVLMRFWASSEAVGLGGIGSVTSSSLHFPASADLIRSVVLLI